MSQFDTPIPRIDTDCAKWDMAKDVYGVDPKDGGIPMWIADMDFAPPAVVNDALERMKTRGVYGYYGDDASCKEAICWWMSERHNWHVQPEWIFFTHGLVNGMAMCVDSFTDPGDGVVLMTPVYHCFFRVIKHANRQAVELQMPVVDGKYALDIDAWETQMTGREKLFVLCSPHNPGGRVWTRDELTQIAEFCHRHDLILVSDEIHHDLVYAGHTHTPMATIEGISERLVMMTAPTKTFNIAGSHTGNVIISNPELRAKFFNRMEALGMSPNAFGLEMTRAAYSPDGIKWLTELMGYLEGNRQIFDSAIAGIPGLRSMPMEATYLAWVDFSGTGMSEAEYLDRVQNKAKIAPNFGPTFGTGGQGYLRFNLATQRNFVEEAAKRLKEAFADLQ